MSAAIRCTITDISSLGAFVRPSARRPLPSSFDLSIGGSHLPRACRIARREAEGFGVEFLDPVRHEVEEILGAHAFREELMFEALSPAPPEEVTATRLRIRQTALAIMELIERGSAMMGRAAEAAGERPPARLATV